MIRILYIFLSCVIAVSCSKKVIDKPINQRAITIGTPEITKSVTTNLNIGGTDIGVYGYKYNLNSLNSPIAVFNNQKVTYNGSTWDYSPTKYWDASMYYTFIAYHPYRDESISSTLEDGIIINNYSVIENYDAINSTDLLVSNAIERPTINTPINFSFNHVLSNLKINLCKGADWGSESISYASLTIKNLYTEATLKYKESANWIKSGNTYNGDALTFTANYITQEGVTLVDNLLMIPQEINPTLKFIITYRTAGNNQNYTREILLLNKQLNTPWSAGKKLVYTLIINPNSITFNRPTTETWNSSTHGGNIVII